MLKSTNYFSLHRHFKRLLILILTAVRSHLTKHTMQTQLRKTKCFRSVGGCAYACVVGVLAPGGGGGGDSYLKTAGVLSENFEKNP